MKKYKVSNSRKISLAAIVCWLCFIFSLASPSLSATSTVILRSVPFTAQAPLANWRDPKQQDACEEASALMAVAWARQEKLGTAEEVEKQITILADYELKKYGGYQDTSAQNTVKRIFWDYFQYPNATSTIIQSASQIIKQLQNGNLVIAPVNGQKLKNPFYARPGPERHMLLIKGYDFAKKEFITNDTGTRRGNNYRYPVDILENAMRDYLTGNKKPIKEVRKAIIIVKPE